MLQTAIGNCGTNLPNQPSGFYPFLKNKQKISRLLKVSVNTGENPQIQCNPKLRNIFKKDYLTNQSPVLTENFNLLNSFLSEANPNS